MKRLIIIVLAVASSFHCVSQNVDYYDIAYSKIVAMLEENNNSFKEAVFTVENAYFDNQLDLDFYYKKIEKYADFCVGIKESGNVIYDGKGKDRDKALMQYSVFAFFTEKIPILNGEQVDTVYPFKYNYEDFAGKNDWSNMFVSKLMQTKQGNCHSLPYLYKIIMDELGEKSYLSLCPNHLYIKVQNEKMGWYNIELTNSNFPTDAYLMSSGYVHIDAIRNGIYMKALTQQESIALCLIDLAQGYMAKFGVGDGEFVLQCCETALKYFPDCITAMLLESRILAEKYQDLEVKGDEQFAELTELTTKIHKLGYRKMPERMYQNWLNRMQSEEEGKDLLGLKTVNLTASQANIKNPFADYGLDKSKMIRTAAETVFEEFFDLEDTVELGNVYFNIRTNKIAGFISAEKLKNEVAVDLIAISVDPKAELYWWISPYSYCLNNPLRYIDPTGMSAVESEDYYLNLKSGEVEYHEGSKNRFNEGLVHLANDNATVGDIENALSQRNYEYQKDASVPGGFKVDTKNALTGWNMMQWGQGYIGLFAAEAFAGLLESVGVFYGAMKGLAKQATTASTPRFSTVDNLIEGAGKLERLKGGVKQGNIQGNANNIFKELSQQYGAKIQTNGTEKFFQSGNVRVGLHESAKGGGTTLHINNSGQLYKIRVTP